MSLEVREFYKVFCKANWNCCAWVKQSWWSAEVYSNKAKDTGNRLSFKLITALHTGISNRQKDKCIKTSDTYDIRQKFQYILIF
jgi:hypothetical protein